MAGIRQTVEIKRRKPRQARAEETVAAILEATAQILEAGGLAAFTTNAVAERAGVSIGTLYQYFADKNAILRTLAERELQAALERVARALKGETDPSPEGCVRAMVRTIIGAFGGRLRARKAIMQAVLSQGATEILTPIAAFITQAGSRVGESRLFAAFNQEQIFVVSRAMLGTIRAAVLEEQPFFTSRSFEDELVRLVLAYAASVSETKRASTAPG